MKIEITQYENEPAYYRKSSIEFQDDANLDKVIDSFRDLLVAVGYSYENIKEYFND